jgi:NADH-ubiquinone oxidoreductase chain 4
VALFLSVIIFIFNFNNLFFRDLIRMGYGWALDSPSFRLIILSFWVRILMYFSSYKIILNDENSYHFSFFVLLLMFTLFITFRASEYLLFYFFFEVSIIPTLLIIIGWGYQPERLQAGVYFLFYTLTVSLPLLVLIVWFRIINYSFSFINYSEVFYYGEYIYFILLIGFTCAFLVKLPMFFTHLWLPKAHVEAPVAGSMILAGVLLKLGGYGLFRVLQILYLKSFLYSSLLYRIGLLGIFFVGLMCFRLNDFKALVAYSSVAHMAIVICGIFSFYIWGFMGSLIIIIRHGLASSGLFCIVNIYYERLGRRSFYFNKGLILILPTLSLIIFMLRAANMAAPPTVNLISEIFLMVGILGYDRAVILLFPIGSFLGAVFTLFMFSYSQHGKIYYTSYSFSSSDLRELHSLSIHIIPVNLLILKGDYYLLLFCLYSLN